MGEPFQGLVLVFRFIPGLSLRSNPGLELANASGVIRGWLRLEAKLAGKLDAACVVRHAVVDTAEDV